MPTDSERTLCEAVGLAYEGSRDGTVGGVTAEVGRSLPRGMVVDAMRAVNGADAGRGGLAALLLATGVCRPFMAGVGLNPESLAPPDEVGGVISEEGVARLLCFAPERSRGVPIPGAGVTGVMFSGLGIWLRLGTGVPEATLLPADAQN